MKFGEGPWWMPALFVAVIVFAVLTAPAQTGQLVGSVVRNGVAAIDAATGDKTITLPAPPPEEAGQ